MVRFILAIYMCMLIVHVHVDWALYFESLTCIDGCFMKPTYFSVPCPATVTELKAIMSHVPELFQYKTAILSSINRL